MSCWTKEEVDSAEGYAIASDHEYADERWEYVADMMQQDGMDHPVRTPNAYRTKLHRVWRDRQEQQKFMK